MMPTRDPHPPDTPACWLPALSERYFLILGDGSITVLHWAGTPFDHGAWQFGNCFKTHRDAARARDVVTQILRLFHSEYKR